MPLQHLSNRIYAALIDKTIVVVFCSTLVFIVEGFEKPFHILSRCLFVSGASDISISNYGYYTDNGVFLVEFGYPIMLITFNALYILLTEITLGASLGKFILGGIVVYDGEKLSKADALVRFMYLYLFSLLVLEIRYMTDMAYVFIFIIGQIILCSTMKKFSGQTLIEKLTNTDLSKRKDLYKE
jgi:RDD family.